MVIKKLIKMQEIIKLKNLLKKIGSPSLKIYNQKKGNKKLPDYHHPH